MVGGNLVERLLRPFDDQPIGTRDPLGGGELGARVGNDRSPAQQLRRAAQRFGGVDRSVDDEPRRWAVPLCEDLRAVVELEQAVPATPEDLVELPERLARDAVPELLASLDDEPLRARSRPLDDGEQHRASTGAGELGEPLDHSTRSTNTSISPPQGRPTSQASSSLIP